MLVITEYYLLKKKKKENLPCFKSQFYISCSFIILLQVLRNLFPHAINNKQEARYSLIGASNDMNQEKKKNCITNKWRGMYFQSSFRFLENQVQIILDERIGKTEVTECETKCILGFTKLKRYFLCVVALSVWIHVGQPFKAWTSRHSCTKKSHAKQGISIERLSIGKYEQIKKDNNENNIASLKFPFFFPLKNTKLPVTYTSNPNLYK